MNVGALNQDFTSKMKIVEALLIISLVGLAVYIGYSMKSKDRGEFLIPSDAGVSPAVNLAGPAQPFPALQPYEYYKNDFEQRDLFSSVQNNAVASPHTSTGPPETTEGFPSHLRVTAIVLGNPSDVVIEDKNTKSSLFLKEGESAGDLKVLQVSKDAVSINYFGKKYQLTVERP